MKKIIVFGFAIILIVNCKTTQNHNYFTSNSEYSTMEEMPKNLNTANKILNIAFSDSLKNLVRNAKNDTIINIVYPYSLDYYVDNSPPMFVWYNKREGKNTKLVKYLSKRGINDIDLINEIVLISFKNYLNNSDVLEKELFNNYRLKQKKIDSLEKIRFTTDTIYDTYIPIDIKDCLTQLDKILGESTQQKALEMSEDAFVSSAYLSIGYRVRNLWQINNGSRLSKYFENLGIKDTEIITSIIFTSYSRHKKRFSIKFEDQIKQ